MIGKIKGTPMKILEPSAGKGDIIEAIEEQFRYRHDISAIEKDKDLRATLRGKRIKVIDSDFLAFSGPDKFDLIIANPPFNEGDKHLLKAIDILYRGEIVFLLNAETIKNPFSNTRKELVKKLEELNTDIEYISNGFETAERPTKVEVALVHIKIDRRVEDDLFIGADDTVPKMEPEVDPEYSLSTGRKVEEMVAEYNQTVKIATETIVEYYRNYRKVGRYIGLNKEPKDYAYSDEDLTELMQSTLNTALAAIRKDYWRKCLDLREVYTRMTRKKQSEFEHLLEDRGNMDFTENNIRSFVLNLIGSYEKTLTEAVLEIFHKFTEKHAWDADNPNEKNIHYFNGWKTNKAFKVNKKVIIPIYCGWGGPFVDSFTGEWRLEHDAARELRDIDVVMNYFDGRAHYYSISEALEHAFARGQSSKIESTYFTITAHKKGTIHLTFNDEGILRRFNIAACMGKGWLPCDYGKKSCGELPYEERKVVESFEGRKSYIKNHRLPVFANTGNLIQLEEPKQ